MEFLITISTVLLALLTGVYVVLTYKLLSESKRANELNQEAFRSQFQIATYPHLACDTEVRDVSAILSIQNLGTLPATDVDIIALGLYSEDDMKLSAFIESYINKAGAKYLYRLHDNEEGFYGVYDHIYYSTIPQQMKVLVRLSYPILPSQILMLQQFRDIVGINYYKIFWFFSEINEPKIDRYRIGSLTPKKIIPSARIKFDQNLELRTEDGSDLPEDVRAEFGMYWKCSIACGHTVDGYIGVEDRGIWSSIYTEKTI